MDIYSWTLYWNIILWFLFMIFNLLRPFNRLAAVRGCSGETLMTFLRRPAKWFLLLLQAVLILFAGDFYFVALNVTRSLVSFCFFCILYALDHLDQSLVWCIQLISVDQCIDQDNNAGWVWTTKAFSESVALMWVFFLWFFRIDLSLKITSSFPWTMTTWALGKAIMQARI